MKRLIAFLLLICISFSFPVTSYAAIDKTSLAIGGYKVEPGETISVPISLSSNSGFVSMSLSVTYDTSALTLISYEDTGVIDGAAHSSHFTSPYVLSWENDELTTNITSTGTIVYLTFLASEDAKEQDYSIIVRIPTDGILDANGDTVSASSAMGTITVCAEHECSFGAWEYYSKTKHIRYCDGDDCDEKEYKNHNWNDGEIIEEPSHDEEGEIKYTCEDCDYSYTTEIDPEGHDWGDWTKFSDTQHKRTCSCGDSETEEHNWDDGVIIKHPTATEEGIKTYACEDCDASKTERISPNPIPVTGVALNKTSETLKIGTSVSLIANVSPSNATNKNVTWSSSDSSIASVVNGVVTANKVGTATITATTEDGGYIAQCMVVIYDDQEQSVPVTGITLSQENVVLKVDELEFVDAIILPDNATNKKVIWKSSDLSVVDIAWSGENNLNGMIVARNAGKATITATTEDGNFVAQCEVTVNGEDNSIPVTGITLSESSVTLNVGDYQVISASLLPFDATNTNVIWTSDNPAVASLGTGVDDKTFAVIQAEATGTATITATTANGGFKATCVVVVTEREKTIVGYKWYAGALRHKVIYSDGTYDMEDCAPMGCVCGRQYNDTPDIIATIEISSVATSPGETIAVHVKISDNPGLASLVLALSFDQSLLTLTNVEYNPEMGGQAVPPASMTNPVKLYWVNGFADYTGAGVFATLTFAVSEEAKEGDSTEITVSYTADDVFNVNNENVQLNITEGRVTITDYIAGDINGDGNLNNKDVTRFMQYNAGWDVEVNEEALDVNGDGSINNKDVTRLMQYIAGWDVKIH